MLSILGGCGGQGRWTKRPKSMTSIVSPIPAPKITELHQIRASGKFEKHAEPLNHESQKPATGIGMLCEKASSLARCGNQTVGAISQDLDINLEHQTFLTPIFHSWQIFKASTLLTSLHRRHNRFLFRSKLKINILYISIHYKTNIK